MEGAATGKGLQERDLQGEGGLPEGDPQLLSGGLSRPIRYIAEINQKHSTMGYIEKSLGDGERVIAKFKIHWYAYLWLFAILGLLFTEIALTSKKVIVKKGVLSRRTDEMKLNKVENVELKQSLMGRILGFGEIIVSGTGSGKVTISKVTDPIEVKKQIEAQLD